MNKVTMGNDFTSDDADAGEEEVKKLPEEDSGEEKENSADASDSKNENIDENKDESSEKESEGEEKSESEEEKKEESKEPTEEQILQGLLDTEKKIDGDTTDIKAQIEIARKRISDKRRERREGRDLVQSIDSAIGPSENEQSDDLSDVDPDTIKVLERFTKARGLVPKSELGRMTYQQKHKDAEDTFYATHAEYLPDNDTEDLLYKALKTELSLYAAPTDARLIPKLFEKAHEAVLRLYPDKFKSKKTVVSKQEIVNKSALVKKQSLGGSSSGSGGIAGASRTVSGRSSKSFDSQQLQALRDGGWSEDDIKDLTK